VVRGNAVNAYVHAVKFSHRVHEFGIDLRNFTSVNESYADLADAPYVSVGGFEIERDEIKFWGGDECHNNLLEFFGYCQQSRKRRFASSFLTSAANFVRVTRAALQKRVNTSLLDLGRAKRASPVARVLFSVGLHE